MQLSSSSLISAFPTMFKALEIAVVFSNSSIDCGQEVSNTEAQLTSLGEKKVSNTEAQLTEDSKSAILKLN